MALNTSKEADEIIESIHSRVGAENKAVLSRSAICLALAEGVPSEFKAPAGLGKGLSSDALFGELEPVIRAALNFRAGKILSDAQQTHELRRHFEWGCQLMRRIWEDEVGRDQGKFIVELLRRAKLSGAARAPGAAPTRSATARAVVETEVKVKLLIDAEPWTINRAGANSLLVVSGQPGRGKSQLALDLLAQLARQGVRFLFFDLKGEMEPADDDEQKAANRALFLEQTGATYLRLVDSRLPINPLFAGRTAPEAANIASRVASLVRSFGPQMGANQEDAIRQAYTQLRSPDFPSLLGNLQANGANGVAVSVLSKIVDLGLFSDARSARPFEEWLRTSVVIDFKPLDNDTRALAVAFILSYFIERLNKNLAVKDGVQPLQMVLFVDEAHNLLPRDRKAQLLEKLAREGRSWGFPLWLASQDADKFVSSDVDFASLAPSGLHFSPETLSAADQKQIVGGVVGRPLEKGQVAGKVDGKFVIGAARQFWRDGGK
jgi:DNA sulfur modification protein DndE